MDRSGDFSPFLHKFNLFQTIVTTVNRTLASPRIMPSPRMLASPHTPTKRFQSFYLWLTEYCFWFYFRFCKIVFFENGFELFGLFGIKSHSNSPSRVWGSVQRGWISQRPWVKVTTLWCSRTIFGMKLGLNPISTATFLWIQFPRRNQVHSMGNGKHSVPSN